MRYRPEQAKKNVITGTIYGFMAIRRRVQAELGVGTKLAGIPAVMLTINH
jgi:hypothetical protein